MSRWRAALGLVVLACNKPSAPRPKAEPVVVEAKSVIVDDAGRAPKIDLMVLPEAGGSIAVYADGTEGSLASDLRVITRDVLTVTQTHAVKPYSCEGTLDEKACARAKRPSSLRRKARLRRRRRSSQAKVSTTAPSSSSSSSRSSMRVAISR